MSWSILDVYASSKGTIYVDLNPATFFENHAAEPVIEPKARSAKMHFTSKYNVAAFIELSYDTFPESITINGQSYEVKKPEFTIPIDLQLCLVFKDEWDRIPLVLDFYKRVHGVQRFILYDNQSVDPPPPEILARKDTVYHKWDIPYKHTIMDKSLLDKNYDGPAEIIIGQNSAYSHCLKRYRDATWTALLDTDEFIVRRRDNEPLISLVRMTSPEIHSIIIRGYWAGCNQMSRNMLYQNFRRITKRAPMFCMNKLILRTNEHVYTNCIHAPYPTATGKQTTLAFERGYYFFHLYTASAKLRRCVCRTYCQIPDKSLQESFMYMM